RSRNWTRVMSPRPGGSILMTSAPSQARIWVHEGPDWTCVTSRTRTPSNALSILPPLFRRKAEDGRLSSVFCLPSSVLLVHGLVHRARREGLRVHPDVDQRRLAGLACPLQRGSDVARIAHLFTIAAEHLREQVVLNVAQLVAGIAALPAVLLDLAVTDLVHVGIVADHADERQIEAHHRLEVPARHAEGAVAEQAHDLPLGLGEL